MSDPNRRRSRTRQVERREWDGRERRRFWQLKKALTVGELLTVLGMLVYVVIRFATLESQVAITAAQVCALYVKAYGGECPTARR